MCFWVEECQTNSHSLQARNLPISSSQSGLEPTDIPQLYSLSPPPVNSPIASPSSVHLTPFDTFPTAPTESITETENDISLSPSPSSPAPSDTDMSESVNVLSYEQANPFPENSLLAEAYERVQRIVVNGEEDPSIKKKNKDVPMFLIERPLEPSDRGKGSRGGIENYLCAFPPCDVVIQRKDRAIDHILKDHFGARPYKCKHWCVLITSFCEHLFIIFN
jgi:hypothetical protein